MGHQNFHDRMVDLARRQDGGALTTVDGTVYSIAFVTATPTFTGVIGGYTTLTDSSSASDAASSSATDTTTDPATAPAVAQTSAPVESSAAPTTAPLSATSLAAPASIAGTTSAILGSTNTAGVAATTGSASSDTSSSSSSGISTGAKAGIAVGIIALVGLVAIFLLWLLGKKRRQLESRNAADNEKSNPALVAGGTEMAARSPPVSATAPRISLRPVSRMLPEFVGGPSRNRMSAGNMLTTVGESNAPSTRKTPSPQPRGPSPSPARGLGLSTATQSSRDNNPNNPFADPQNPFADPEKLPIQAPAPLVIAPSPVKAAPIVPVAAATSTISKPIPAPIRVPAPVAAPIKPISTPEVTSTSPAVEVPAPLVVAAPAQAQASPRGPVSQIVHQQTASPASSAPGSPALVVGAGAGSDAPQGNVYRVLMDFAPSMEDELELKSGQLVRLLHEYDDGWALCIRLDRSQQGVVPRTCLAGKPSKPKPSHLNQYARPSPGGPGPRPMSPAGGPSRPMSPTGRSMSPAGRPMSPANMRRPMSPGFGPGPRAMSPGPRAGPPGRSASPGPYGGRNGPPPMAAAGRPRSNSASNARERRNPPAGPSKLGPGAGMAF